MTRRPLPRQFARAGVGVLAGVQVLAAIVALPARAQSAAESAYDRVAQAWAAHRTLDATFEQKIVNALLGRTATSHGTFRQAKPNQVSITFTDPAGDRIVGDGRSLWVYLPSSAPGQVLKLPADADGAVVADLLGQLFDTPRSSFTITGGEPAPVDGRPARRVQLTPRRSAGAPFVRATLWLDDERPLRVLVVDAQGVERTITLTSWTPNVTLPRDVFTFTVPKGVKVVTSLPGR